MYETFSLSSEFLRSSFSKSVQRRIFHAVLYLRDGLLEVIGILVVGFDNLSAGSESHLEKIKFDLEFYIFEYH